jgi:hypothetical protein
VEPQTNGERLELTCPTHSAGYWISAIFICSEYQRLGVKYRQHSILALSFWIKLFFILLELFLVIAFAVLGHYKVYNVAAVFEWCISVVFIFYIWSFIIDFLPATRTRNQQDRFPPIKKSHDEMAEDTEAGGNMFGGPVYSSGGHAPANGHATAEAATPSRNF